MNEIFKTQKLSGGMFFIKAIIKFLWRFRSHKLFNWEDENTLHLLYK